MYRPSFDEFRSLAAGHTVVPVFRTLLGDTLTPVSAFAALDDGDRSFLFESVVGGERIGRFSFLGAGPFRVFEAYGNRVRTRSGTGPWEEFASPDPLKALEDLIAKYRAPVVPGLPPFAGGAVGFAGYDAVRYVEHLPATPTDDRGLPDLCFGLHDRMVVFDHIHKTVLAVAHASRAGCGVWGVGCSEAELRADYDAACRRVDGMVEALGRPTSGLVLTDIDAGPRPSSTPNPKPQTLSSYTPNPTPHTRYTSNFTREAFEQAVRKTKEYILAGDAFQVVASQRFRTRTTAKPFDIYRALRVVNPSPFMFFVRAGGVTLVGASPEIMCRVENGVMTNRPLAGTRRRGGSPEEDTALAEELIADPKERAEHIMLVDLARNDVGKVCELGSVKIADLLHVERYSHVMHLSSTVTGMLKPGLTAFDAMRSALPAGTLSGAPKVRAMQIIDEIEPTKRGPYGGAVGYVDFSGNTDTCIALRTMVIVGDVADVQAGAGLVADSDPAAEYQETVNKAMGLMRAVEIAEGQL